MTKQLEAVLMIAKHPLVVDAMLPVIDEKNEQIDFNRINYGVLSGGGKALVSWAWCIWKDQQVCETNEGDTEFKFHLKMGIRDPFEGFCALEPALQALVLRALATRHGVKLFSVHD